MTRISLMAALASIGLVGLTACDQFKDTTAAQTSEEREAFLKAVDKFDAAYSGIFGESEGVRDQADPLGGPRLRKARFDRLEEVAGMLEPLLDKGPKSQQVYAARLYADAKVSMSRYLARRAGANWARLLSLEARQPKERARLVSLMASAERMHQMANAAVVDESALRNRLTAEREERAGELSKLKQQAQQLQSQITSFNKIIENNAGKRDELMAEAQSLRSAALTGTKQEKMQLLEKHMSADEQRKALFAKAKEREGELSNKLLELSIDMVRSADAAEAEADRAKENMIVRQSELAILEKRVQFKQDQIETIEKRIAAIDDRAKANAESKRLGMAEKARIVKVIDEAFNDVNSMFSEDVDKAYDRVDQLMASAAKALEEAYGKAKSAGLGDVAQQVRHELLLAHVERLKYQSDHAAAASEYARKIDRLAGLANRVSFDNVGQYNAQLKQAKDNVDQLAGDIRQTHQAAVQLAGALAQEGSATQKARAAKAQEQITTYSNILSRSGVPVGGEAPATSEAG